LFGWSWEKKKTRAGPSPKKVALRLTNAGKKESPGRGGGGSCPHDEMFGKEKGKEGGGEKNRLRGEWKRKEEDPGRGR